MNLRITLLACLIAAGSVVAQPVPRAIPDPVDRPYPGAIRLAVDATDLTHHVFHVRETLPVAPGPLTLLYPLWIPGWHGPGGDVTRMANLVLRAGAQRLAWTRDPVQTEAFHLDVPAGVTELAVEFDHLAPIAGSGGRTTVSRELLNLDWYSVLLVPAGHRLSAIRAQAALTLPAGFRSATALRPVAAPTAASATNRVDYAEVSVETLIDSPVFAGLHHRRVELEPVGAARPVALELFADEPEQIKADDAQIEAHRALVRQADRLFGARHFAHYDLLLEQSKTIGGIGLEHHESSENGVKPGYFKDWAKGIRARQLLPHEYVHSWNGKFRRPADLWTPNLNVPMRNSMLWVYEGQTEYWGRVLGNRSGLVTIEQARDQLARTAAFRAAMPGRGWRSLQDTTADPLLEGRARHNWYDLQRGWDYYDEMALVWLDVDTLIRERSRDKRSLDDFARAFFGVEDGRIAPLTYTFDDLVAALNAVEPYDWAALLRDRLDRTGDAGHLLDGLARSGWKLDFDDQESDLAKNAREEDDEDGPTQNLYWSIGVVVGKEGKLAELRWDGPAFRAGLAPGMQIVAVKGLAYKPERLAAAITEARGSGPAVELLVKDGDHYRTFAIDDHGGLRYPKLVRLDGVPDRLSAILAPK
jgi:predicted metalloprotease with PDZ domain